MSNKPAGPGMSNKPAGPGMSNKPAGPGMSNKPGLDTTMDVHVMPREQKVPPSPSNHPTAPLPLPLKLYHRPPSHLMLQRIAMQ